MSETIHTFDTIQRLEAEIDRMNQELRRLIDERDAQRAVTCCVHAIEDPTDPRKAYIVRGTVEGIHALEALLRQRFHDGYELGRVLAGEQVEQLTEALKRMSALLEGVA